jgi:hypothetical protein
MLDEMGVRDRKMGVSQQFDGRWLVCYLGSGRVEIQGLDSKEQAIEYIQSKPAGEFVRYVYVEREVC